MNLPKTTPVSPALHRELVEADAAMKAVNQMIQMFQNQAQVRLTEAQTRAREAWSKIAAETGLDLNTVAWEPHPTEPSVVPVQMRFRG
jgi:hypothetical protein